MRYLVALESPELRFDPVGRPHISLIQPTLILAGYTGSDDAAIRAHIDEMAAIGVPKPSTIPTFTELNAGLLTSEPQIVVLAENTSGEAEPVLIRHGADYYLGLGSDHTDRDMERESIPASKAACPKPVGRTIIPMAGPPSSWTWGDGRIASTVDGKPYQDEPLLAIRTLADLLAALESALGPIAGDLVMFCGTVGLIDGEYLPGEKWLLSLQVGQHAITHSYETTVRSS